MFDTVQHCCARTSVDVRVAQNRCSLSLCLEGLSRPDIVVLLAAVRDKKDGSPMRTGGDLLRPFSSEIDLRRSTARKEERRGRSYIWCSRGFIRERDEWGRKRGSKAEKRGGGGKGEDVVFGLKEERKSIAFISYIVNLVSGSNDS